MMRLYDYLLIFSFIYLSKSLPSDEFSEELYIRPLPTGHVYNHLKFTTKWDIDTQNKKSYSHFRLFPKSIGEIVSKYEVQELHLSLTQGLWNHQKWGYALDNAPPGVQLWVWFKTSVKNIDTTWKYLTNALSGQFCASLNFVDETNTINPKWSFRPTGVHQGKLNNTYLRFAALPRENVCTENLTPWKKLLPCGSEQGLSKLLNAGQLFNAHYNSLIVKIRPICRTSSCAQTSLELSQSVSVVFEASRFKERKQDWSLVRFFGAKVSSACSLARHSRILVDQTSNIGDRKFTMNIEPTESFESGSQKLAVYDVKKILEKRRNVNLEATYEKNIPMTKYPSPSLYSHRFIAGFGQEHGEIKCQIFNKENKNVTVIYQEVIPWFIRIYFSKLKIKSSPRIDQHHRPTVITPLAKHYKPSKDRQSPAHIEMIFVLPPSSVTEVTIEFTRGFLKWTEHPPDANHGFYINAATISAVLDSPTKHAIIPITSSSIYDGFKSLVNDTSLFLRFYSETLLVSLPTPDFSMPYNVICLACTVVALAFGPLHNITTKRLTAKDANEKSGLVHKIKSFINFRKSSDKKN